MESDKTIKRTIRIPIMLNEELNRKSRVIGKSVNQVILEDLRSDVWNRSREQEERTKVEIAYNEAKKISKDRYKIKLDMPY